MERKEKQTNNTSRRGKITQRASNWWWRWWIFGNYSAKVTSFALGFGGGEGGVGGCVWQNGGGERRGVGGFEGDEVYD